MHGTATLATTDAIASIILDEKTFLRRSEEVERERATAITDLLAHNRFRPDQMGDGPYHVSLSLNDNRLIFWIHSESSSEKQEIALSVAPFKRIIKDYFLMYESYQEALISAEPHRLEAIDMGRRGIHNEGSELLQDQLNGKITLDFDTARRLFTLICVLHIK
ncbi:MAG: hypothetical protein CMM93_01290 [Rickettsiales bacterium]|nr:hypothetical protein [Rickettsiales bacterium]|tara:strand:+ start:215 stop:703 length:489 start_codon:yes stop_codon:yes gene_type:complete